MTDELSLWVSGHLPNATSIQLTPLKAEASFRQFYRVRSNAAEEQSVILMTSPPDKEHNDQFIRLATIFIDKGIPVPEILATHMRRGWFLMSDLGGADLESAYRTPARDEALTAAIGTLVRLQQIDDPAIPIYSAGRLADELTIFAEWFVTEHLGMTLPPELEPGFEALVDRAQAQHQCCVHRDYHCRNLLFNDGHFGVVDFQDALMGPVSYDLASLLHDCYQEFSEAEVAHWRDAYLTLSPLDLNPQSFAVDVEFSAVQRQLKAVGIFTRLHLRDGKSSHLRFVRPVIERTTRLCRKHPALHPIADWLNGLGADRLQIGHASSEKRHD